jgi:hypothetical protein
MNNNRKLIPLPFEYIQFPQAVIYCLKPTEIYLLVIIFDLAEKNDKSHAEANCDLYQSPYAGSVTFSELRKSCSGVGKSKLMDCLRSLLELGLVIRKDGWRPVHPLKWDSNILKKRESELWEQREKLKQVNEPMLPDKPDEPIPSEFSDNENLPSESDTDD